MLKKNNNNNAVNGNTMNCKCSLCDPACMIKYCIYIIVSLYMYVHCTAGLGGYFSIKHVKLKLSCLI